MTAAATAAASIVAATARANLGLNRTGEAPPLPSSRSLGHPASRSGSGKVGERREESGGERRRAPPESP